MEIKVEKGQFRWKVLNLLFWGFVALTFPTILFAFNFFIDNLPIFITGGVIASIFFNICIFLQKNWPIDRRVQAALYTTICLVFTVALVFVPYYLFLLPNHRRYDNVEYISLYMDAKLLSSMYKGIVFVAIIMIIVGIISFLGTPGQYDENYYKFICIMLLCTFITSALLAIPTQRCIYRQAEWSRDAKIRNIVNVELVFLCVNAVAVSLFLIMLPLVFFIMPFLAFVGATLLIHIFIKSSLDAPEHEE